MRDRRISLLCSGNVGTNNTIENNLYYDTDRTADSGTIVSWDVNGEMWNGNTFNEWVGKGKYDQNAVFGDPSFVDAANGDFTLSANSPAIDVGEDLGNSYDDALKSTSSWPDYVLTLDQDDYGSGWEIGADISVENPFDPPAAPTGLQIRHGQ